MKGSRKLLPQRAKKQAQETIIKPFSRACFSADIAPKGGTQPAPIFQNHYTLSRANCQAAPLLSGA